MLFIAAAVAVVHFAAGPDFVCWLKCFLFSVLGAGQLEYIECFELRFCFFCCCCCCRNMVLKVGLYCEGCVAKVRCYLSRLNGRPKFGDTRVVELLPQ